MDSLEPRLMFATTLDLLPANPLGSRVYTAEAADSITIGETDEFEVTLLSGQKLSARVLPSNNSVLKPTITILDNSGNVVVSTLTAADGGKPALVQRQSLSAGTYTIQITGADDTEGRYALTASLNTVIEAEPEGTAQNNTPATGVNLNGQTVLLQGSGRIANASGIADGVGAPDLYRLDLTSGEAFSALIDAAGNGYDQFQDSATFGTVKDIYAIDTGDFNEDGLLDVVVGGEGTNGSDRLQVLINDGNGGYTIENWGGGNTIWDVAVGDFNQDGDLDIATLAKGFFDGYYSPDLNSTRQTIFYGSGDGTTWGANDTFIEPAYTLTAGDLNNDGADDLAIGHFPYYNGPLDFETPTLELWMSDTNTGHLNDRRVYTFDNMQRIYDIQIIDVDGDGFNDVVTAEGSANTNRGRIGIYKFSEFSPGSIENDERSINDMETRMLRVGGAAAPGGGLVSLIALHLGTSRGQASSWILDENGNAFTGTGWEIVSRPFNERAGLVVADVNRDGYADAVTTVGEEFFSSQLGFETDEEVHVNLSGGDGFFFGRSTNYEMSNQTAALALGDLNNDGDLDVITGSSEVNNVSSQLAIRLGRGEVSMKLLDASGNTILFPNGGGFYAEQGLLDYVATFAGAHYIQVDGDVGQQYQLAVSGGAKFGIDPENWDNRFQTLTKAQQAAGRVNYGSEVDRYKLDLKAGDVINASVIGRTLGIGDGLNNLTPVLRLFSPGGVELVVDENLGSLPTANLVNYVVTADGEYTLQITSNGTYGDYDVLVSGNTGSLPPFTVRDSYPSANASDPNHKVDFRPDVYLFFSHPVLASSVQPGDLLINGQPALGIADIRGDYVGFRTTIDNGNTFGIDQTNFPTDGTYTVTIPAGAILSSLGVPIEATTFQIQVDANGPRVISSSIENNQVFEPGPRTWSVEFTEPIREFINFGGGFSQVFFGPEDIQAVNLSRNQSVALSQMQTTQQLNFEPIAQTYTWNNLGEGLYESRLKSGFDAFSSSILEGGFRAHNLDGEFNGAYPSGDGYAGGDFVKTFIVDAAGVTPLTQLTARAPAGSIVHDLAIDRAFHATGDVDSFSISLDSNQQITVMLVPTGNPNVEAKVEMFDPIGGSLSVATGSAGQTVLLNAVNGTIGGTYRIDASSLNGIAGYTLRVIVNAATEAESVGTSTNNSRDSAEALNVRTLVSGFAGVRSAIVGDATGSDDYYKIDLVAGQAASFALSGIEAGVATFEIQDASGNTITKGAGGQGNADYTAIDYVPPASGTCYVVVSGTGRYNLLATRAASYERDLEVTPVPPQDLSVSKQVVGHLKGGPAVSGEIDVLHVGADFTSFNGNQNHLIDQINNSTAFDFNAVRTNAAGADTYEELQHYDVVILADLSHTSFTPGLASALKKFVELGGAVIVAGAITQVFGVPNISAFAPLLPFDPSKNVIGVGGAVTAVGAHPITQSYNPFSFPVGVYSPTAVLSGATVVAAIGASPTLVVRENIGFGGRTIFLGPEYGSQFNSPINNPSIRTGNADLLLEQTLAWAAESGDQADTYSLSLNAGNAIVLTTSSPNTETALPVSLLDPVLELYDPSGVLVASNDNGPDGRNSRINYTATVTGTYKVMVRTKGSGGGAYTLQVTGATGSALVVGPTVVATTPKSSPIAAAPTTIDIVLSESILAASVQASDLTIVGGSVTGVQLVDGRTVRFSANVPNVHGTYTYTLAAGAFTDLQGDLSEAFVGNFTVDRRGPYVISSNPASQASSPFTLWSFAFSEDLVPLPSSYNYEDFFIVTGPNGLPIENFRINNPTIVGNVFNVRFGGLTAAGTYTIALKPGRIMDLRGNLMDQDQDGINGEATEDRFNSTVSVASPNLVVDSVNVLTPAVFGSPVTIEWTVRNAGTDPANDGWQDRLYLSANNVVDGDELILLTIGTPTVPLAAGASYTRTQTVTLPLNTSVIPGNYRFIVRTDRSFNQQESNDNDNDTPSAVTNVTLPALPDLAVSDVEVINPATPASGGQATVRWTLTNVGTATVAGVIREQISLSGDSVVGSDTLIGDFDYAVNLTAGQSVTRTAQVTLPVNQYGQKWIVARTDAYSAVFEHTNEANNVAISAPINITLSPVPDLVVTAITAPANVVSGTTQSISWTLANNGTAAFSGTIVESIYLSADDAIGGDDLFKTVSFTGTIAAGTSITRNETIDIPIIYSGTRRVVIQTDQNNNVFEDVGESNNLSIDDATMTITIPPTPDLVVSSITAPATTLSARTIPIEWQITNNGTGAMTGSFTESVYLSPDASIGNDAGFAVFTFTGTILPGQTVNRSQSITIPNIYEGTFRVVVVADSSGQVFENAGEGNNALLDDQMLQISQAPFPNLIVGGITAPSTAFSEDQIDLEWVVTNSGNAGTNALAWYDRVYLSPDATFDSTDTILATVQNASYLNAGEGYLQTAPITLPKGLQGDYYFFIQTDINNNVFEYVPGSDAEGDNRTRSGATTITLSPPPDLMVTNVVAPLVAFSGQLSDLAWTIANNGAGGTRAAETQWVDQVYLSTDNTFSAGDTLLGQFAHTGGLAVGASYNASGQVRLPIGVSGDYYFIVRTDSSDQVYEDAFEANNTGADTSTTQVLLAPPPDLHVTSLTVPATGTAGRTLAIDYEVTNEGAEPTPDSYWVDNFYLSPTPTINPATLIYIGQRGRNGALVAGQSYAATFNATVPLNADGQYYVFVQTDANNNVFELDNANNVVGAVNPTAITQKFADLQIGSFSPPATAAAASVVPFTWTVNNTGTGDSIVSQWSDRVAISADNVYGNGDDITLGYVPRNGLLGAGASYTRTEPLGIPQWVASGTYNVFLGIDASQQVVETNDANNVNAFTPSTITIVSNKPDLRVTGVTAPASASGGETVSVSFTVQNFGGAATGATSWVDELYLSRDGTIGSDDVLVQAIQRTNVLPAGAAYTVNTTVKLPDVEGGYFLVARTDRGGHVVEELDTNNDGPSNAIAISLQPLPDLTVSSVTGPATTFAGQSTSVSWTVANAGAAINSNFWYDTVYLSADTTLDRSDSALGSYARSAPLAAGASYNQTQTVVLPPGLSGQFYFLVSTDNSTRIFERDKELNNVGFNTAGSTVQLLPPVDLVAGTFVLPVNGAPGQTAAITYTVTNGSATAAQGTWTDSLYLSTDTTWDINDKLFTKYVKTGPVAGGDSYSPTVTAPIPGVTPGEYYVIVRSDILNNIPESDENNNLSASIDKIGLDVPGLVLDTPSNGTLGQGQGVYYRVTVPEGETLLIDLDAAAITGSTQLYVKFGDVPTRSSFDFGYDKPLSADQKITVPKTKAGTYYILAFGDSLSAPTSYSIEARILQFEVIDTNYGIGGNGGKLTLQINGAKFDRTILPTLVSPGGGERAASQVFFSSSTRLYATFDLTGLNPAAYDVKLTKTSGPVALVPDSLSVVPAQPAQAKPVIFSPPATVANAKFQFTVSWGNDGINDIAAPYLVVGADRPIGQHPDFINVDRYTFIGLAQDDGPAGVLRPDQTSQREFYAKNGPRGGPAITLFADRLDDARRIEAFDWETMRTRVHPSDYDDGEFAPAFAQMIADIGPTWGNFVDAIAEGATLYPPSGDLSSLASVALDVFFRRAAAKVSTSLSGRLFAADIEVPIAGQDIVATNTATGETFATLSFTDGSFIFDRLAAGTYALSTSAGEAVSGGSVTIDAGQHAVDHVVTVDGGARVSGLVRRSGDNAVVGEADITLIDANDRAYTTVTDANGAYLLSGLPAGTYLIYAQADGLARSLVSGVGIVEEGARTQNFTLVPQAKIIGTVTSPVGPDTPLRVSARLISAAAGEAPAFNATIVGGSFDIGSLPAGTYNLVVAREGYVGVKTEITIVAGQTLNVGNIQLLRGGEVRGTVTSSDPGFAPTDATLGLRSGSARDDLVSTAEVTDTGEFAFVNVTPGTYTLFALADSTFIAPMQVVVTAGGAVSDINLNASPGGAITGTVTETASGQPVEGANVTVAANGAFYVGIADAAGVYTINNLPLGTYIVSTSGDSTSAAVTSLNGTPVTADLQIQVTAVVHGTLEDAGGQAIVGSVSVIQNGALVGLVYTDAAGRYAVRVVNAGVYDFVVQGEGAFPLVNGVTLSAGTVQELNFVAGTSRLDVTVTDSASVEGSRLIVYAVTPGGNIEVGAETLAPGGAAIIRNLLPGNYEVVVRSDGNRGATSSITVGTGVTSHNVPLAAQAMIRGVVTGPTGAPLKNAGVTIVSTNDVGLTQSVIVTDANGRYEIGYLPAGTYAVSVVLSGYKPFHLTGVAVATGATVSVDAPMIAGTSQVTGRLVDASGQPVASGSVTITNADNTLTYGVAVVQGDGTFTIVGSFGTNLKAHFISLGGARTSLQGINIADGGAVALGDLVLAPRLHAFNRAPSVGGSFTASSTRHQHLPQIALLAADGPPPTQGLWDYALYEIKNLKKESGHVYKSDIAELDKCMECVNTRQAALNRVILQDRDYLLAQELASNFEEANLESRNWFVYEAIQNAGYIATAIIAIDAIIAAIPAYAGMNVLSGTGLALGGATGLGEASAFYSISYTLTQVASGLLALGQTVSNKIGNSNSFDDMLESTRVALTTANGIGQLMGTVIEVLTAKTAPSEVGALKGIQGGGGVMNLIALALDGKTILENFTFTNSRTWGQLAKHAKEQFTAVHVRYIRNVYSARDAMYKMRDCVRAASDICDGTNDNPFAIKDFVRPIPIQASGDPNDILGPAGYGPQKFVPASIPLDYTIRFENMATATAPAQVVKITQTLDSDLDPRTFRLGDFGFSGEFFDVPAGSSFYQTRLDLRETRGIYLDVAAGVDIVNNQAFWQFISIDPATGDVPTNPQLGFLPINTTSPEGEGFVQYTIRPDAGAPTGTVIDALATIVFDQEAPIDTPAIFNTLDGVAPDSSIDPLPAVSAKDFVVFWNGDDDANGSAIATFDVYVSRDGHSYDLWLDNTDLRQGTFSGVQGSSYAFYAVAVDNVGNIQPVPPAAQATTSVESTNTPPTLDIGPATGISDEGSAFARNGLAGDVDTGDMLTAEVDYGAGAGFVTLALNPDGSFALSNIYADNGTYTITVNVRDTVLALATQQIVVTVGNVNPVVANINDVVLPWDGTGGDLSVGGSFLDPGADTWTAQIDYGSGFVPLTLSPDGTFSLSNRYTAPGLYTVTVKVADDELGEGTETFTVRLLPPPPVVASIQINDGNVQRSMVKSLVVRFDYAVTTFPASAVTLTLRTPTGSQVVAATMNVVQTDTEGKVWTITFTGTGLEAGSLADGVYDISIAGTGLVDPFGQAGTTTGQASFHRLFGDSDGDRDADALDQTRIRAVLGKPASYLWYFDLDADSDIDNADFTAARLRLNKKLFA